MIGVSSTRYSRASMIARFLYKYLLRPHNHSFIINQSVHYFLTFESFNMALHPMAMQLAVATGLKAAKGIELLTWGTPNGKSILLYV